MFNPLVSVIIPVYNAEKYIAEALDSIFNQSYTNFEIIAVNDGSRDNSLEVLEQYSDRIKIIQSENRGIGSARNIAIKVAKGEFLAFLDADDIWEKDNLAIKLAHFEQNPDLDVCFGAFKEFLSPDIDKTLAERRILKKEINKGAIAGNTLVKTKSFLKVGYFETKWKSGEFIDWIARANEHNLNIKQIVDCVYLRRSHNDNHTFRETDLQSDYLKVIRAALERKRQFGH